MTIKTSRKMCGKELGHVLLPPDPGTDGDCRGIAEVISESVAYMVTQAHGLDASQYTFAYVAGWASQAATPDKPLETIIAETGTRAIGVVDTILRRTQPVDAETQLVDSVAEQAGITTGHVPDQARTTPVWESVTPTPMNGLAEHLRQPPRAARHQQPITIGR